jgi:hypothetical protein
MHDRARGKAYPGHGAVIENCRARIMEYIGHRQQRESEVLRVLKQPTESAWTPIDIVKVMYKDVPTDLHLPASHGVSQVLMKLENDGKVVWDGRTGGWRLRSGQGPAL